MEGLDTIPLAYASCSIGTNPERSLPDRLAAISSAGFSAIELSMPDLVSFANTHFSTTTITDHSFAELKRAAHALKPILTSKNLSVFMLQPFSNFEGWPHDSPQHRDAWTRVTGWSNIMLALDCPMLQVGSSDSPAEEIGTDRARFVEDLTALADYLAPRGQRVAYENWCWSTHAPDWKDVWEICRRVDRENFGLCLDTFQSAGGEWGDPTTASGLADNTTNPDNTPTKQRSPEEITSAWKESCRNLSTTIPKDKIFLLQISDAYPLTSSPLQNTTLDGLRPKARWSHDYRPLPFEGYLPVVDFTRAVLETGFRGWFSYEIFDGGSDGTWEKNRTTELGEVARRARECQGRLMGEVSKSVGA